MATGRESKTLELRHGSHVPVSAPQSGFGSEKLGPSYASECMHWRGHLGVYDQGAPLLKKECSLLE